MCSAAAALWFGLRGCIGKHPSGYVVNEQWTIMGSRFSGTLGSALEKSILQDFDAVQVSATANEDSVSVDVDEDGPTWDCEPCFN